MNRRFQAYSFLLVNTLCWGAAFVVVEPALKFTTPFQFLFYRFALASVLTIPLLIQYLKKPKNRSLLWKIAGIETLGTVVYMSLLYEGLSQSNAIEASLLGTTTPLFVIAACILFLREKQTRREWTGLAISFAGVVLIAALPLLNGRVGMTGISIWGNLLILLSNCVVALYAIIIKRHYLKIPPLFAATISFWLGAVAFGLLSLGSNNFSLPLFTLSVLSDWQQPSVTFAALYMAIFGSIIGLTAYVKGQKLIEASEASLFYYLQPLVYLPLGIFLLGENFHPLQLVGLTAILVGVGISELRR